MEGNLPLFLSAVFEDGNTPVTIALFSDVVRAMGMTQYIKEISLMHDSLYKKLSPVARLLFDVVKKLDVTILTQLAIWSSISLTVRRSRSPRLIPRLSPISLRS